MKIPFHASEFTIAVQIANMIRNVVDNFKKVGLSESLLPSLAPLPHTYLIWSQGRDSKYPNLILELLLALQSCQCMILLCDWVYLFSSISL